MNFKLGEIFKIPLYLNFWVIPFALLIYSVGGLAQLAIYILALSLVVLHEYGHCFAARGYGWTVHDVHILPIGGVANVSFKYNRPFEELMVAAAGPVVNVALVALVTPFLIWSIYIEHVNLTIIFLVFFAINLSIVLFNMLPVYPMDGGRVLRALLSYKLGHERASWWAVRTGQCFGCVLSFTALFFGYWMAGFILIFMGLMAQGELSNSRIVASLHNIRERVALKLNNPELLKANLPELIMAIELVEDEELKRSLETEETLPLLKALQKENFSI